MAARVEIVLSGARGPTPAHLALMRELGDLKRIRSAGRSGSLAARLFRRAWAGLCKGADADDVMRATTAAALAAMRLGDLDREKLAELGFDEAVAADVLRGGFDEVAGCLDPVQAAELRAALGRSSLPEGETPPFVDLLEQQPRAGVTCPGKPRIMLEPAESHADHCLAVAVGAAVMAPTYGADPGAAFLAGLAHHLHNALMPDSGFTGEILLGDRLDATISHARAWALAQLPERLQTQVTEALAPIGGDETPEARAFHAADVIDRVVEIEAHLRAVRLTMDVVLDDYALVHAGPVKSFHDHVLAQVGLA